MSRTHVVMVPGFGGFDALGQLTYYTGVTPLFQGLRRPDAALHYFDNLPTAAVPTRALALGRFLDKLDARRVIESDDKIVLIGHSTGGLDIRQLIRNLHDADPHDLLTRVKRLVFLSVPQFGTNIADWVRSHGTIAHLLVSLFRRAVGLPVAIPLAPVEWLLSLVAPGHPQLLDAVDDAERDMKPAAGGGQLAKADAHAARAEIALWLEDIDDDFLAINDLSVERPSIPRERVVDDPQRDRDLWAGRIATRSYATRGRRPFDAAKLAANAARRATGWQLGAAAHTDVRDTDAVYRIAYTACAGGPFRLPGGAHSLVMPRFGGGEVEVEAWDNDGIVNTASERSLIDSDPCFVVDGDHADIIGHYQLEPKRDPTLAKASRREDESYDLLGSSAPGSFAETFADVWRDVFAFALS